MTPTQEIAMTLFTKETLELVKYQFESDEEILANESFDMSFVLHKPTDNHINLELATIIPAETKEERSLHKMAERTVMFLKPIGFYNLNNGNLEVTIVKEFEDDIDYLIAIGKVPSNIRVNKLSLIENAVLASFSMEALCHARNYEDTSFFANGIQCDIFMTFEGFPQIFLNDKYNLEGPIAAYLLKEQNSANPIFNYKDIYNKYLSLGLMTAYREISE